MKNKNKSTHSAVNDNCDHLHQTVASRDCNTLCKVQRTERESTPNNRHTRAQKRKYTIFFFSLQFFHPTFDKYSFGVNLSVYSSSVNSNGFGSFFPLLFNRKKKMFRLGRSRFIFTKSMNDILARIFSLCLPFAVSSSHKIIRFCHVL